MSNRSPVSTRSRQRAWPALVAALVLGALVAGCADGRGVIQLRVVSTGGTVAGVVSFRVRVVNAQQSAGPYNLTIPGGPLAIPPDQSMSLSFDARRSGPVDVFLDALDGTEANANVIASGTGHATLTPSQVTTVTIDLKATLVADMGMGDDGGADGAVSDGGGDDGGDLALPCGVPGGGCCKNGAPCQMGCCGSNGLCAPGTAASACGTSGMCTDCTMSNSGHGCYAGACGCNGPSPAECPMNQACDIGRHVCNSACGIGTTFCNGGCCSNNMCTAGSANKACGSSGNACTDCTMNSSGHICIAATNNCGCNSAADCPSGNACDDMMHVCTQMCLGKFLCNGGCCDGMLCQPGTSNDLCGAVGGACVACTGNTPTCTAGTCTSACTPNGMGGAGACGGGTCCNAMNVCAAQSPTSCGIGGACVDCTKGMVGGVCVMGVCGCRVAADCPPFTACVNGACTPKGCGGGVACNSGCCAAANCASGMLATACGKTGAACVDCSASMAGHACVNGSCGCNSAMDCPGGMACNAGTHLCGAACDVNTLCNGGCCSAAMNGMCLAGTAANQCGNNGGVCSDCPTLNMAGKGGKLCVKSGNGGVCGCVVIGDCPNGQSCSMGLCTSNCSPMSMMNCNTGCCSAANNGTCLPGTANNACGVSGTCADCATNNAGHVCVANLQKCGCTTAGDCPAGLSCNTTTSQCDGTCGDMMHTSCNGGCCQNGSCVAGMMPAACGAGGAACVDCTNNLSGHTCVGGACKCASAADCNGGLACDMNTKVCTTACGMGQPCRGGCCGMGGVCQPGTANGLCGTMGGLCTACSGGTPTCSAGACTATCGAGGNGVCGNGTCCQGGMCVAGTKQTACGFSGTCNNCQGNAAGSVCETGNAGNYYCGCNVTADCLPNYACSGGKVSTCTRSCAGGLSCNTGCCNTNNNQCVAGANNNQCGSTGMACVNCGNSPSGAVCIAGPPNVCGCLGNGDCGGMAVCMNNACCFLVGHVCAIDGDCCSGTCMMTMMGAKCL